MSELLTLLERFGLTETQAPAALERSRDVSVTAGAGSGKTRTLVARYMLLLAENGAPRGTAAITFTEKAAREMRNRVRREVRALVEEAEEDGERSRWSGIEARLDAARISTIHSLCQEILRAHPVEAGLDPEFGVLDEGQTAVLRARSARDSLARAAGLPEYQPLFQVWKTSTLEALLNDLLARRLDVEDLAGQFGPDQAIRAALSAWLEGEPAASALAELAAMRAGGELAAKANTGDRLAPLALGLLEDATAAWAALENGDTLAAAQALLHARQANMLGTVGSGAMKAAVKALRDSFDADLKWLGGKDSPLPTPTEEALCEQSRALLLDLYRASRDAYLRELRLRGAVDFDDLEGTACRLLRDPGVAGFWQGQLGSLLVDEFQDTNARQRDIVRALCGPDPGRLFVVGDARQSIYRFRGADVTVFRGLQDQIRSSGGLCQDLAETFRAHKPLLDALADLLAPVMGSAVQPGRPYHVPFSALTARRDAPRPGCAGPHVELVLGAGEDRSAGRAAAARALCRRLLELKHSGQIGAWDEVALLFRASTGFPAYEDAFEQAGIPYVTVAGRGFYQRPEIRDLLNLLRALADPWDDLALTGLLRSPVFGLSRAGLARLRLTDWSDPAAPRRPIYASLRAAEFDRLSPADQATAQKARAFLAELAPLVDRIPVGELLARIVTFTDYRAVLAGNSSRLWRNVDKLLADASASGLAGVQAFLEYLETLGDAGAREGEAPAEAEGALRLMSIHKSKGLEFDVVVLADAARQGFNQQPPFLLLPEAGLVLRPDRLEGAPLAYRFASRLDSDQSGAETQRLLYVALTRAREKVLISGHVSQGRDGKLQARGWLKELADAAGLDLSEAAAEPGGRCLRPLACGEPLGVWVCADPEPLERVRPGVAAWPESAGPALFSPFYAPPAGVEELPVEEDSQPLWRMSGGQAAARYARAVGKLTHLAIQRWLWPGDARLDGLLAGAARSHGLVSPAEITRACADACGLLARLRAHSLWAELDAAEERLAEVPYSLCTARGRVENGFIDLLYRGPQGWGLVEFKTGPVGSEAEFERLAAEAGRQVARYRRAVRQMLGGEPRARIVFVDDRGGIRILDA